MIARAYVNFGRWVAECPRPECTNALELRPRQDRFVCDSVPDGCGMDCPVEWPENASEIWEVLTRRPVPKTRNWFPSHHLTGVLNGYPNGQTVADLLAENKLYGVQ